MVMSKYLRRILIASALLFTIYICYDVTTNYAIPYFNGYRNEVNVGAYTVKMDMGWYPFYANSNSEWALIVKVGVLSKLSPGSIRFQFFQDTTPEWLEKIRENSDLYKKYEWGTVLKFRDSYFTDVLHMKSAPHIGNSGSYYVPELGLRMDVHHVDNLDEIKEIRKTSPRATQ